MDTDAAAHSGREGSGTSDKHGSRVIHCTVQSMARQTLQRMEDWQSRKDLAMNPQKVQGSARLETVDAMSLLMFIAEKKNQPSSKA